MDKLAYNLRVARMRARLTQNELEDNADIPFGTISHFEIGDRVPTLRNLKKLSNALGVSIDSLANS